MKVESHARKHIKNEKKTLQAAAEKEVYEELDKLEENY